MTGFGDPVFNPAAEGPADRRAAGGKVAARSIATVAYTDFWRGRGRRSRAAWRRRCRSCPIPPMS